MIYATSATTTLIKDTFIHYSVAKNAEGAIMKENTENQQIEVLKQKIQRLEDNQEILIKILVKLSSSNNINPEQ